MARHKKCRSRVSDSDNEALNYHEGLSPNQVKVILREFGFYNDLNEFNEWMGNKTCPLVFRKTETGEVEETLGIYEFDLMQWIKIKKDRTLFWD